MSGPAGATRYAADAGCADDIVLAFRTVLSRAQGRVVRLGRVADDILSRHDYPDLVSRALGEAIALSTMLGSLLHADGRLILQTRTDGPLRMLVVDYTSPGNVRAMASFDPDRTTALETGGSPGQGHLLGTGHLAMTIDPGGAAPRTQGIVALANHSLAQAAHTYFRQSEQIPTFVRLAVARHQVRGGNGAAPSWHWRAGGLIVQQLPEDVGSGGIVGSEADDDNLVGDRGEDWQRTRMLAATVEDHELLDPTLPPEQLLLRLFAQEGVTVTPPVAINARCSCTRQRVKRLLEGFGADEIEDMREPDGGVTVTCEYCSMKYRFTPDELGEL
jgi:molecular chaperone Hsp33